VTSGLAALLFPNMNIPAPSASSPGLRRPRLVLFLIAIGLAAPIGLRAAEADPAAIAAHGQELQKQKKYVEAIAEYDQLVKLLPRSAEPYILRGWAKHLAGDDLHGLADLEMALARKPNDLTALNRRALVNYSAKFWSSAAEDYAAIAKQDPKDARSRRELANCLMMDRKPQEALAAAEEAVAIDPANTESLNLRGAIRQNLGDFSGALADVESVLKVSKDEEEVAALTKVRERLAAKVAANPPPPAPFQSAADVAMKAAAPTNPAAAAGSTSAEATPAVAQLNINQLSAGQYNGAVSVAMEGMRLVLAPLSADETTKFEKKWTPMFSHPSAENIAYLNKLNPLVQDFLVVRSQTAEAAAAYDKAVEEARFAAAYESAVGTRTALWEAGRCLELLQADKVRMGEIVAQIQRLGDPPDAAAAHRKRKGAHAEAINVAKRAAGLPEQTMYMKIDFYNQSEGWSHRLENAGAEKAQVSVENTILPADERLAFIASNDAEIARLLATYAPGMYKASDLTDRTNQRITFSYHGSDMVDLGDVDVDVYLNHAPLNTPENPSKWAALTFAGYQALTFKEADAPITWFALDTGGTNDDYWVMVKVWERYWDPAPSRDQKGGKAQWAEKMAELNARTARRVEALIKSLDLEIVDTVPQNEVRRLQSLQQYAQANPLRQINAEDKERLQAWAHGYWALRSGCDPVMTSGMSSQQEDAILEGRQPENPLPPPFSSEVQSGNGAHTYFDGKKTVFEHTWTRPPARLNPGPFDFQVTAENTKRYTIKVKDGDDPSLGIVDHQASVWVNLGNLTDANGGELKATAFSLPYHEERKQKDVRRLKVMVSRPVAKDSDRASPTCLKLEVRFTGEEWTYVDMGNERRGIYENYVTYIYDWGWELGTENSAIPPSVLPASMSGVANTPPPTPEDIAKAEAEAKWKKERISEIRENITFLEKNLAREQEELGRETDTTRRGSYEFRVLGLRSDIQAEEDMIKSLETGLDVHTRSPFDEYAGAQFVQECQTEAREASQMVRAVIAANRMAALLPPDEAEKARAFIQRQFTPKAIAAHDVKAAHEVLQALGNTVQGHFQGVAAQGESEAATAQFGMDAASNIKTAADTGMGICSAFGGKPINYIYQAGTGYIEGGPVQALKAAGSAWSNKIDYAITAYDTYQKDGALSAGGAVLLKVAQNYTMEYIAGKFAGPGAGPEAAMRKPTLQEQFDAAKFKQEREWGEALVKDFQQTQAELMKAGAAGASPEAIMKLQAAARDKAAAIASSLHAKNYLKYKADPAVGKAYDTHMRAIHAEADAGLMEELKQRKWNTEEMELMEFRNSASYGKPNMDRDVGLRERSLWQVDENGLPMKGVRNPEAWTTGPNGQPMPKPQLTKEGKTMTLDEWREEAQALYNQAYRKASGGRSADIAMEGITTSTHPEAYKDLMWLGQDKTLISQAWAGQAGDVTRYKAMHILNKGDPSAAYFTKLQEVARGTAKDLESKLLPLLKTATPISGGGLRAQSPISAEAIARSQAHWGEVQSVLQSFGRNDIDPITATRRIRELTGGKSIPEVVDSMATLLESLAKGGRR
jgi:tetratricopeptide (TPR) repeat protein